MHHLPGEALRASVFFGHSSFSSAVRLGCQARMPMMEGAPLAWILLWNDSFLCLPGMPLNWFLEFSKRQFDIVVKFGISKGE